MRKIVQWSILTGGVFVLLPDEENAENMFKAAEMRSWRERYKRLKRKHTMATRIAAVLWVLLFLVLARAIGTGGRVW